MFRFLHLKRDGDIRLKFVLKYLSTHVQGEYEIWVRISGTSTTIQPKIQLLITADCDKPLQCGDLVRGALFTEEIAGQGWLP